MRVIWCGETHNVEDTGKHIVHGRDYEVCDFEHKHSRTLTISLVGFNRTDKPGLYVRFPPSLFTTPEGLSAHLVKAKPSTEAYDRYGTDDLFIYDLRPGDRVLCRPFGKTGRPHPPPESASPWAVFPPAPEVTRPEGAATVRRQYGRDLLFI